MMYDARRGQKNQLHASLVENNGLEVRVFGSINSSVFGVLRFKPRCYPHNFYKKHIYFCRKIHLLRTRKGFGSANLFMQMGIGNRPCRFIKPLRCISEGPPSSIGICKAGECVFPEQRRHVIMCRIRTTNRAGDYDRDFKNADVRTSADCRPLSNISNNWNGVQLVTPSVNET
jgi:hypothetical protein